MFVRVGMFRRRSLAFLVFFSMVVTVLPFAEQAKGLRGAKNELIDCS